MRPKVVVLGLFRRQFARLQAKFGGKCDLVHCDGGRFHMPQRPDAVVVCTSFISHKLQNLAAAAAPKGCRLVLVTGGVTQAGRAIEKIVLTKSEVLTTNKGDMK